MMDIEVDPQLFVTCRLCLKETGLYQICPKVQHEIKYCFDIGVQTFDGLPQLICKKCKTILKDYYEIKTLFVEKQLSLKLKVQQKSDVTAKCQLEQEDVKTSQTAENPNNTHIKNGFERKSSVNSTVSTTSEDVRINKREENKPLSWKNYYNKYYMCRLCQKRYKKKYTISMHISNHNERFKYSKILRNNCTINLNKIDDYPNLTGTSDAVVYSHDKILFEERNAYYHVLYVLKNSVSARDCDDGGSDYSSSSKKKSSLKRILTVSSDEEIVTMPKSRKKFRLLSKSSNDTVVIEGNNRDSDEEDTFELDTNFKQMEINHTETIDIDDSSSEDFQHHSKIDENEAVNTKDTILPMQHIASACKKKYLKKLDSEYDTLKEKTDKETAKYEPLLNHKILSIGRKVINSKKGFDCTGLLRFMEHKNLEIVWISNDSVNVPKETNYVRIMPKLRADQSVKNLGWRNLLESVPEKLSNDQPEDNIFGNITKCNTDNKPLLNNPESHCQLLGEGYEKNDTDHAVLYLNSNMEANSKNKLLNANPVLNPKQLPKNIKIKQSVNVQNVNINQNTQNSDNDKSFFVNMDTSESESSLPIITSTTSLAAIDIEDKKKQKDDTRKLESALNSKQTPRIKVKPASELMTEKALNRFSQQQFSGPYTLWPSNENQNTLQFHNPIMSQSQNNNQPSMPSEIVKPPILNEQNEGDTSKLADSSYIILHTTDLPNKKTYSPFKYFKDVLYIHGMILLDSNESLSQDFSCLMKFKLVFRQDTRDQPITLCLSIFCNENKFCLNVKDNNQQNIDINKVSANWQWEILKACKGDTVNRLLLNAEKQGAVVYGHTKRFIALLKSIKMMSQCVV